MTKPSVVFTQGTFDLLHSNHINALRHAKALGTKLIVGVHADEQVKSYKRTPVLSAAERLKQVEAIRYVDHAFLDTLPLVPESLEQHLQRLNPDHYVYFGDGWETYFAPATRRGILRRFTYHDGVSTSGIIEKVRSRIQDGTL